MRLSAVIHKKKGWFIATNPDTGTTTQGETFDEALANLREATELYLEEFPLSEPEAPILTTFEVPAHASLHWYPGKKPSKPCNGLASFSSAKKEAMPFYAGKRRTAPAGVLFPCTEKFSLAPCGAF